MRPFSPDRAIVDRWIAADRIERPLAALRHLHLLPDASDWHTLARAMSLWCGLASLVAAVIFFFAFNWTGMSRLAKLATVQAPLVVAILSAWWIGIERPVGAALLVAASLLVGALLALIGQQYQTGADPWQLFAVWALAILPWTLLARQGVLWLLVLVLANLALWLHAEAMRVILDDAGLSRLVALNLLALIAWELGASRAGLGEARWAPRSIATLGGVFVTMLGVKGVFDSGAGAIVHLAWLGAMLALYNRVRFDLFMLAGTVLSGVILSAAFLGRHIAERGGMFGFLFVGLATIGLAATGARWLRGVARSRA